MPPVFREMECSIQLQSKHTNKHFFQSISSLKEDESPYALCVAFSIQKHSAKALHPKGSRALGLRSLGSEQMAIRRNVLDVSGCRLRNWILLSLSL